MLLQVKLINHLSRFNHTIASEAIRGTVAPILKEIVYQNTSYGFHSRYFENLKKERILVEFSSPNIAKKFHAGHFRSTIIGNTISNILKAAGHDVVKVNYLGDWGIQFALLYIGYQKYGNKNDLEESPLKHLLDIYVKINKDCTDNVELQKEVQDVYQRMELNTSTEAAEFWDYCRKLSLEEFKKLYSKLNISFDYYLSESMYIEKSQQLLTKLKDNLKLTVKDDQGRDIIDLTDTSWYENKKLQNFSNAIIGRSNGTALYLTRDIASILDRKENIRFDKIYYVTDQLQSAHFAQLFAVLEKMKFENSEFKNGCLNHISFGRVNGMQTRKGEVVFLEDILDEAFDHVRNERQNHKTTKRVSNELETVHNIALAGLICNDLQRHRKKNYNFSWEQALASKGHTGTFLQYTHSRLCNLEKSCGLDITVDIDINFSEGIDLAEHLHNYPKVCKESYVELEPQYVALYLFKLCHLVSKCLRNLHVKNEKDLKLAQSRLLLFHCSKIVLNNGIKLLGAIPIEKM